MFCYTATNMFSVWFYVSFHDKVVVVGVYLEITYFELLILNLGYAVMVSKSQKHAY